MGTPEKDLAPHHAHQRTIAEYILRILGVMAAYHGDTAGHEFTEIIPHRTKHPKLGRFETGVVFGHGHAAGADVAGNTDFTLGHGIAHAIGRIAVNHDGGTGVEPAHIIGHRPFHFDQRVGKPHGTHALTGRSLDTHIHLPVSGTPQAAADAVLTVGMDLQAGVSLGHRCLDLFFQKTGLDALVIDFT